MIVQDKTIHKRIKKALTEFHNPAYLRKHPLVQRWPASLASNDDRGKVMQKWLQAAIERLKPNGTPSEQDKEWRPYSILHQRYIEGLNRQQVMIELGISKSEFYRQHNEGIAAVVDWLERIEAAVQPLPVNTEPIPRIEHFVGRQEELERYRRHLRDKGFVILSGMAGVGKTALAAELVSRWQEENKVVWFCFRQGRNTDIAAVLEGLALSLATLGQDEYWRFLQMDRQREKSLSQDTQIRYLINVLSKGDYVLCIDNFEVAGDDAAINSLLRDLLKSARLGQLRLLVMSRVMPVFATGYPVHSLSGLCLQDARRLLAGAGLSRLPEGILAQLYDKTSGVPVFLKLFATWVQHSHGLLNLDDDQAWGQTETFVSRLARQRDVRHYLLREMYDTLRPVEQRFLEVGSAFRLHFEERAQGITRLLAAEGIENVERALNDLVNGHLLTSDGAGNFYLHPLIREYCYERLAARPADKSRVHGRLAAYYEGENDPLEAAYHYEQAGEHRRAIVLLADNYRQLVAAGQAQAALKQLEQLAPHLVGPTDKVLRFELVMAREQLYDLLGQRKKQQSALKNMLALAEELGVPLTSFAQPPAPRRNATRCGAGDPERSERTGQVPLTNSEGDRRLALAYNRQARFHQVMGDYSAAISTAKAGQAAARRAGDKATEAESLYHWGVAQRLRSNHEAARERHEQALVLAREAGDQQAEAANLNNLGNICYRLENYITARGFYQQALTIRRTTGDLQGEASVLNNLGNICYRLGDLGAALHFREQALVICQIIGDRRVEAASLNNLGSVYCDLGEYTAARVHWERALAITRSIGERQYEGVVLSNLGDVCREEENYATARAYQEQALAIQRAIGDQRGMSNSLTGLGRTMERLEDLNAAEAAYGEGLAVRRETGQIALAIENVAGLGRVALARGQLKEARQCAQECLTHLSACSATGLEYPFEVYLTCARILKTCGERERARAVLEEAGALLMEQAEKINGPQQTGAGESLRSSFLENILVHRALLEAMDKLSAE